MAKGVMPGAGFIGDFYADSFHGQRSREQVHIIYTCWPCQSDCGIFQIIFCKSYSHG